MKLTLKFCRALASGFGISLMLASGSALAQEVIPDFYREPGLSTGRDLTDQHDTEHIDPFTGSLQLHYTDIHVPGNGGFSLDVVRSYNSTAVDETNPDAYVGQAGVGWTIHFGRVLSKFAPLPCTTTGFGGSTANNPVIETADGSRQVLNLVGTPLMMSTSFWKAECASNGIGLIVYSPDGVRYDMTHQVNVSVGTHNQIAWYTTKITDRNGNYATVNYASATSAQISSVTTSDGRGLNFGYVNGLINTISTTGAGASTYTYNYTKVTGSATSYQLTSVLRPDGTSWKYIYNASLGTTAGSYAINQLTFPQGGTLTYTYGYVYFDSSSNPASRSTVVSTKKSSDGGTWTMVYTPGAYNVYDTTVVTGPEGAVTYKHVGPNYAQFGSVWLVGSLMSKALGSVQAETYQWAKMKISAQTNMRPGAFSVRTDPNEVDVPVLTSKTTVRNGATYSFVVNTYDSWGKPTKTTETGPGGGSRVTTLGYYSDNSLWIIDELASQVVTGGQSISKGFDALGNVSSVTKDGIQTSYKRFATGDISQATFPRSLVHNYSNYKRGQPQTEAQPEGINLTRTVDDVGNVTSFTNGELHTTSYVYDGLGRVKKITYPIGNAVTITYTATSTSAVRGSLTQTTAYDGFGRLTSNTIGGIATTYKHDAAGRLTFVSNPADTVGTTYGNFDVLGRYQSVKNADGTSRTVTYGQATKVVVNERNKSTTESFLSYGDPDEAYVMSLAAAEPSANTTIKRDAWNRVHTVTQAGIVRTYDFNANGYLTSLTQPEIGTQTYGRDAAGNMTSRTDSNPFDGAVFAYDDQNRLKGETYSGLAPVRTTTLNYTRTNKVSSVQAGGTWTSTVTYGYDANDNLLTKSTAIGSNTFTTTLGYNANDQVASLTYPYTGTVVNYAPDVLGRPTTVSGFVNAIDYWPSSQVKTITYGNGTVTSYGQNNRLWPQTFSTAKGTKKYASATYSYDGIGNLTSIVDSIDASYSRTLSYDGIDRLTTASGPWGTGSITYDGAGNIKSQNFGTYGLTYSYDANNKLSSLSGSRASAFTYDTLGNMATAYGNNYLYDGVPNLQCVNCASGSTGATINYGYDGNDQRVAVVKGGVTTYEIYGIHDNLLLEYSAATGGSTEYFYLGNSRVAQRVNSGPAETKTFVGAQFSGTLGMNIPISAAVGGAAPTGMVKFYEGAVLLASAPVDSATGFAKSTVKFSTAGTHTVSATYVGDAQNQASTSLNSASISVVTESVVDARPYPNGDHNAFFASVSAGANSPTGTVSFYDNGSLIKTAVPDASGIAQITGYSDGSGQDLITATYPGDAHNPAVSSSATRIYQNSGGFYTTLASYPTLLAANVGKPMRLLEIVKPQITGGIPGPFEPLPTIYGNVVVYEGGTYLASGVYDQNVGISSLNLTFTAPGTHTLTVIASGGGAYLSTQYTQTVSVSP